MCLFYSIRSGIVVHEEKLEGCDAPAAGEKNRTTEQVMVLAANTKQEHGRFVKNFDEQTEEICFCYSISSLFPTVNKINAGVSLSRQLPHN